MTRPLDIESLRSAARDGDAKAAYRLGVLLAVGEGCEPDTAAAIEWLERSLKGGCPSAGRVLGVMIENGHGVPKNKAAADRWFWSAEALASRLRSRASEKGWFLHVNM